MKPPVNLWSESWKNTFRFWGSFHDQALTIMLHCSNKNHYREAQWNGDLLNPLSLSSATTFQLGDNATYWQDNREEFIRKCRNVFTTCLNFFLISCILHCVCEVCVRVFSLRSEWQKEFCKWNEEKRKQIFSRSLSRHLYAALLLLFEFIFLCHKRSSNNKLAPTNREKHARRVLPRAVVWNLPVERTDVSEIIARRFYSWSLPVFD